MYFPILKLLEVSCESVSVVLGLYSQRILTRGILLKQFPLRRCREEPRDERRGSVDPAAMHDIMFLLSVSTMTGGRESVFINEQEKIAGYNLDVTHDTN